MPPTPDPYQELFVEEMTALREDTGLSRAELARTLGCSPQWLSKVESCAKPPSEALAQDLDTFRGTHGTFHRLWKKHRRYLQTHALPPGFARFADLEARA